jgi:hypothetical protein
MMKHDCTQHRKITEENLLAFYILQQNLTEQKFPIKEIKNKTRES